MPHLLLYNLEINVIVKKDGTVRLSKFMRRSYRDAKIAADLIESLPYLISVHSLPVHPDEDVIFTLS